MFQELEVEIGNHALLMSIIISLSLVLFHSIPFQFHRERDQTVSVDCNVI
jgi:hypothetical protein